MAEPLRYPLTKLTSADDYLRITALKYQPPGISSENNSLAAGSANDRINKILAGDPKDIQIILDTFILPIPDDIKENSTVNWGNSTLSPAEVLAGGLIEGLTNQKDIAKQYTSTFQKTLGELLGNTATSQRIATGTLTALATNILLQQNNFNTTLSRVSGAIFNSNIELVFTGVNLRSPFGFAFNMVARSQKEAQVIKEIIRKFKKYSAAKRQGGINGVFLKAPDVFKLEYMNGSNPHPYLNRFKICALNAISVSYTNGTYATYSDGAPVSVTLSLSFQELSPIYSEDYDEGVGKEGTGF